MTFDTGFSMKIINLFGLVYFTLRTAAADDAQWKMLEFGGFFMSYVWSRPFPASSSSPSRANEGPASSAQPWPMAYRPWALAELTRLRPFVDTGRLVRSSRKLPRYRVTQKSPPNSNVSLCAAAAAACQHVCSVCLLGL